MSLTRNGELPGNHFRSDRCVRIDGVWYVATREGIDVGPYRSRERAESAATELVRKLSAIENPRHALMVVQTFSPPRWTVH